MDFQIELVARAFFEAEHEDLSWDGEAELVKDEFREYARNAINLLRDDMSAQLALQPSAEERAGHSRAAA